LPPALARPAAALYTLLLVGAMLTPKERLPPNVQADDKLLHLSAFAVWAVLGWAATSGGPRRRIMVLLGLGLALAVGTEGLQHALPFLNRYGEVGDAVADLAGLGLGLGVAIAVRRRRRVPAQG